MINFNFTKYLCLIVLVKLNACYGADKKGSATKNPSRFITRDSIDFAVLDTNVTGRFYACKCCSTPFTCDEFGDMRDHIGYTHGKKFAAKRTLPSISDSKATPRAQQTVSPDSVTALICDDHDDRGKLVTITDGRGKNPILVKPWLARLLGEEV